MKCVANFTEILVNDGVRKMLKDTNVSLLLLTKGTVFVSVIHNRLVLATRKGKLFKIHNVFAKKDKDFDNAWFLPLCVNYKNRTILAKDGNNYEVIPTHNEMSLLVDLAPNRNHMEVLEETTSPLDDFIKAQITQESMYIAKSDVSAKTIAYEKVVKHFC